MNIAQPIGLWAGGRTRESIENDIHDELEFHIACDVEDLIQQGWTPELAREEAARRFGDRQRIQKQCRKINIGFRAWFTWLSLLMLLSMAVVIVCLAYSLMEMRTRNADLMAKLKIAPAASVPVNTGSKPVSPGERVQEKNSLKGRVVDEEGKPIANAKIFLIHKSWQQQFRMDPCDAETDDEGSFEFEELYDKSLQNAFLVTVFADGYEMKSDYVSLKPKRTAKAFAFKLKKAKTITFMVLGEDGKPLADTDVVLMGRKVGTREYMLYPVSAEDAKTVTGEDGKFKISHLREGDTATIGVLEFGELNRIEHKVGDADEQTIQLQKKR